MKCPTCAIEMDEHVRHGVHIDHCPTCGGVWLDKGELDHLIAAVRPAITKPNPDPVRPAPPPDRPDRGAERIGEPPRAERKAAQKAPKPAQPDRRAREVEPDRGAREVEKGRKPGRAKRYTGRHSTAARLKNIIEEIFDFD